MADSTEATLSPFTQYGVSPLGSSSASEFPVSPGLTTSSYAGNNGSTVTVPEDGDEIWSDAQEMTETDDDAGMIMRESGGIDEVLDGRNSGASVHIAASGLDSGIDSVKVGRAEGKGAAESVLTASVEQPSSTLASLDESPTRAEVLSTLTPPSLFGEPALSSSTSETVPRPVLSLDVPAPSTSARTASPTPTQQSVGSALNRQSSRRRSTIDSRATNRFSGFLSNLIHRRPDREQSSTSSSRPPVREEDEQPSASGREASSRASSPAPLARPATPPPSLPPPSLQELGLSLTAITAVLTPSHFSTPPASGTFLAPHYLLLCHSQGLDVLPLVSPPAPQPYALVRRVSFKSVVVMEERGVLVAIAGRRDGVRVYALEEVKKAVEWRVDVEIRREKERVRREEAKKGITGGVDKVFGDLKVNGVDNEKYFKARLSDSPTTPTPLNSKVKRRKSSAGMIDSSSAPPLPRAPTIKRKSRTPKGVPAAEHDSDPPPYRSPSPPRPRLHTQPSVLSINQARSRSGSVTNVLAGNTVRRRSALAAPRDDEKGDWEHTSSDDEAINIATAGPGGGAALDERTSTMGPGPASVPTTGATLDGGHGGNTLEIPNIVDTLRRSQTASTALPTLNRRGRPAQLDLTLSRTSTSAGTVLRPPPSPTPTVWTLRQALSAAPSGEDRSRSDTPDVDGDDDEDEGGAEPITFAQALLESRLPGLPPPGTRQAQEPIIIDSQHSITAVNEESQSPTSETHTIEVSGSVRTPTESTSRRPRRRWSVLDGVFSHSGSAESSRSLSRPNTPSEPRPQTATATSTPIAERPSDALIRRNSAGALSVRQQRSISRGNALTPSQSRTTTSSMPPPVPTPPITPSHNRFLPRIITAAFQSRRSDEQSSPLAKTSTSEVAKKPSGSTSAPVPPAPKLEYVKLPGTKGAVLIKAVETAKKSFLAILCGENGEKVELFAGTYRTTLGLSRTFILPDSPRSLELQLQGDDLVEVFLVFAQNVFGLEPATVRVREVRVGRAERRAARRRARETRVEELMSSEADAPSLGDEGTADVNVSVGVTLTSSATSQTFEEAASTPPSMSRQVSDSNINHSESSHQPPLPTPLHSEEMAVLATVQLAPYTTFQQLPFAPQFPLATIADECVIPPTYQSFLEYRALYEPEPDGANNLDLANVQFTPPGLPVPPTLPPSRWFYRDPKSVVQGPWKASLMQSWYKDGLLPPDLPVRREEDSEYILLKDLRSQSVDPSHPFRPPPPPLDSFPLVPDPVKPLLEPISLLSQPRHYGPPALFFTTRGGHSTSIVDARGRSVLKGRLQWSIDDEDFSTFGSRLGDVKRLEPFDVDSKAVIVAIRQGGLEVTEISDALMKPGDLSRPLLPAFHPPLPTISRRGPFIWRIGSRLSPFATGPVSSAPMPTPQTPSKKQSLGIGKSPAKGDFALGTSDDYEVRLQEELLFLGRRDENIYFCERSNGSFRILRLCPNPPS